MSCYNDFRRPPVSSRPKRPSWFRRNAVIPEFSYERRVLLARAGLAKAIYEHDSGRIGGVIELLQHSLRLAGPFRYRSLAAEWLR